MAERQYCPECGEEIMRTGKIDGSMVWMDLHAELRHTPDVEPYATSGGPHRHQPPEGTPFIFT